MSANPSTDLILSEINDHLAVAEAFRGCAETIALIAQRIISALEAGGKVVLFGNGGSAADAQHIAAEFSVRYRTNRVALAGLALTTDTSVLTACGNDFGFDTVYARQVEALARPEDVVIGISTSGNSTNVVLGLEKARAMGCATVAFTGGTGGLIAGIAHQALIVPSPVTARIQECHILAGHIICELVDRHWPKKS
jgi:D-sedoheptulose 7-phosphate isomerase